MIVLVPVDDDGEEGAALQFDQPHIHIGRGPHNDLILDEEDQAASYEHALINVIQGRAVVVCEPTAKPTYIDGADLSTAPEEERQLQPGDIISFGKGRSIFRVRRIGESAGFDEASHQKVRVHLHAIRGYRGPERLIDIPPPPQGTPDAGRDRGLYPIIAQVFKGDQAVREESFSQPLIRIGRMRSSHLLLDDQSVSRMHAVIEVSDEAEVLLMDLDSSSGTAVNGKRVKKAILKSGDQLSFGNARVMVSYGKLASEAAAGAPTRGGSKTPKRRGTSQPPPIPHAASFGPNSTQVLSQDRPAASEGPRLLVRRSGVELDEFALTKPQTTIGRRPENDIQLEDGAVSSRHAMLVAEAGVFLIIDQRSTNGTYLNGERCNGESLRNGDVIQIGRYELVFVTPSPTPAQSSPGTEILSPEAARAMFAKVGGRRGKNR
jgi:pSer/pThr/pTyr-binding forkhead associated (FHA) protein